MLTVLDGCWHRQRLSFVQGRQSAQARLGRRSQGRRRGGHARERQKRVVKVIVDSRHTVGTADHSPRSVFHLARCRGDLLSVCRDENALEVELRHRPERRQVFERRLVDHVLDGTPPVEEPQDLVHLVRDLVKSLRNLVHVHVELRGQRGKLLEQPRPLVHAPHPLHQQPLGGDAHVVDDVDRPELDREVAFVPDEGSIDGLSPLQPAERGVNDLPVAKRDDRLVTAVGDVEDAALARDLEGLEQVHHAHVQDGSGEAGAPRRGLPGGDALLGPAVQEHVDAGNEFSDEDRLGEVVLDAELEAPHLVLHGLAAGEENHGNGGPFGLLLHSLDQSEAVEPGETCVREHEVGCRELDFLQSIEPVFGRGDRVARLLQADFEDRAGVGVLIDEEKLELGHGC